MGEMTIRAVESLGSAKRPSPIAERLTYLQLGLNKDEYPLFHCDDSSPLHLLVSIKDKAIMLQHLTEDETPILPILSPGLGIEYNRMGGSWTATGILGIDREYYPTGAFRFRLHTIDSTLGRLFVRLLPCTCNFRSGNCSCNIALMGKYI